MLPCRRWTGAWDRVRIDTESLLGAEGIYTLKMRACLPRSLPHTPLQMPAELRALTSGLFKEKWDS